MAADHASAGAGANGGIVCFLVTPQQGRLNVVADNMGNLTGIARVPTHTFSHRASKPEQNGLPASLACRAAKEPEIMHTLSSRSTFRLTTRFSSHHVLLCALLPLLPLAGAGCGKHADAPADMTSATGASPGGTSASSSPGESTVAVNPGPPVTDTEAKQFSERLLTALRTGNTATLNTLLDLDALAAAATADMGLSDKDRNDFLGGMRDTMNQSTGFSAQLINSVAGGGSSDLLRIVEVDGRKRARVRMIHPNNTGVGYVDFVLGHNTAGQALAQDMYLFYSGELFTLTLHRLAVQGFASQNRSLLERLKGVDNDFAKHLNDIRTISQDLAAGNASAGIQVYNGLPDTLKADKMMKLIHIRLAQKMGDSEYERALGDFRASFPNDSASALLSVDYYILKKQYSKALTALDTLDKALGGDPYQDVQRAGVYAYMHDRSKAQAAIKRAVGAMPNDLNVRQMQKALGL